MSPDERKRPVPSDRPSPDITECTDSTSYVQGLRRRRAASCRLPGGDPWRYGPPTSSGYPAAAAHLIGLGLTPAPHRQALEAMRRRGGRSLRAAKLIAERWDGAA